MRIRQVVFVDHDLEPAAGDLRECLGMGPGHPDPGVAAFGLRNVVMALGDQFIEVVAPIEDGTAAGRHLGRRGPGGYMLILQVDDLEAARRRAADLDLRTVFEVDHHDIGATHLHPGDVGGTILSLDQPDPPASWRWAGPEWTGGAGEGPPGRITGVTLEVDDPAATAERWARLLDVAPTQTLTLDGGDEIRFAAGDRGLCQVHAEVPDGVRRGREAVQVGAAEVLLTSRG